MKSKKTLIIIGIIIVIIAIGIGTTIFLVKNNKEGKNKGQGLLEKSLEEMADKYYKDTLSVTLPHFLKESKQIKITLDVLKIYGFDIALFQDAQCDLKDTFVTLHYVDDKNYEKQVILSCKKLPVE